MVGEGHRTNCRSRDTDEVGNLVSGKGSLPATGKGAKNSGVETLKREGWLSVETGIQQWAWLLLLKNLSMWTEVGHCGVDSG